MEKSHTVKWLLVFCTIASISVGSMLPVNADDDFSQNEREYMERCSSSTMSRNEIAICEEFNGYLKNKARALGESIDTLETTLTSTKDKINAVYEKIGALNIQIADAQVQIDYVQGQIAKTEESIATREKMVAERMYSMQVYVNSNQFISFILGAVSFSDLFSRIDGVNEITSNDKQLIVELNQDKIKLEEEKQWAEEAKNTLETLKAEQVQEEENFKALVEEYTIKLEQQLQEEEELNHFNAALEAALSESRLTLEQQEWLENNPPGGNAGGEYEGPITGDISTVIAAAQSRLGLPYVWGATGPNSFDCSGLTSWAYKQIGMDISRTTWTQIERGRAVGWGELQPGDLIFFSTDGYCSHVGMYVGGGVMIHAPQPGSNVMYSNINISYWQSTFCGARRYL